MPALRAVAQQKIIHTSTSEVYGTAQYIPIDEKHPLQAQSPYAASKIAADKLAESYNLSFGLPITTIRPFNTFGPGNPSGPSFLPSSRKPSTDKKNSVREYQAPAGFSFREGYRERFYSSWKM